MSKKALSIFKSIMLAMGVVFMSLAIGAINVSAEEDNWVHYEGVVTVSSALNVRTGAGVGFDQVKDESGNIIQLKPQEKVIILEDAVSDDGKVWYKVQFQREGKTYEGFATSSFIAKDENAKITPSPTPTPTATPSPSPTPIETATKTPATPTQSIAELSGEEASEGSGNSKSTILFVIFAVIAVAVVFFGLLIVLGLIKQNKRKNRIRNARKVDRMRTTEQENSGGKRRPEIRRSEDDGAAVHNVRQSVYYTNAEDEDDLYGIMPHEPDDKKALRAAVDRLQEHDIINHKIYGEGEVYDNSDVKLMEVRFGNDVRFLNKDSIVAKRLVEIIDDEDQANARRRNRRNKNKRNDY